MSRCGGVYNRGGGGTVFASPAYSTKAGEVGVGSICGSATLACVRYSGRKESMTDVVSRSVRFLLYLFGAVIVAGSLAGCEYIPESTFQLAKQSRVPKWITLPAGVARADVSLELDYYVTPLGGRAKFILRDSRKQAIGKQYGNTPCTEPLRLKNARLLDATYEPVTVDGVTEIMEHRQMEPGFYVTDDPAVWKQYRESGC